MWVGLIQSAEGLKALTEVSQRKNSASRLFLDCLTEFLYIYTYLLLALFLWRTLADINGMFKHFFPCG